MNQDACDSGGLCLFCACGLPDDLLNFRSLGIGVGISFAYCKVSGAKTRELDRGSLDGASEI